MTNATQQPPSYLDVQAHVGITKHIGGLEATEELLALCHVAAAREVLYVGCGIGVGPVRIARKFGCRVIGVDISEKMLAWSRQRAREEGVEDRVSFRSGDVLALPFEDDRFDAVIVESVIVFVEDKTRAIRECARVTRPGGCVGLNEVCWSQPVPAEMTAAACREMGAAPLPIEAWRAVWDASPLTERTVRPHPIDARRELRGRLRWVGLRWAVRAFGRLIALYLADPGARRAIQEQWSGTLEKSPAMGYVLLAGKKPVR